MRGGSPQRGSGWRAAHPGALLALVAAPVAVGAQLPGADLTGRVFDADTNVGVADVVVLVQGTGFGTVTNAAGLFRFDDLPSGDHTVVFQHLAYGEVRDDLRLFPGDDLTLRVHLSMSAIAVAPVLVQGDRARDRATRASGTQSNVITRAEIEPMIAQGQQLDQVLSRHIPGVVVRNPRASSGTPVCVEFRSPRSIQDPMGCKAPTVFLDGVRLLNPGHIWKTFPIEEIQRLEVVPSVEAGARYGTDSNYGVLLIETRTGRDLLGVEAMASGRRATYDWALESRPYPWLKTFASSFLGNAVGLAAGAAVGSTCFEWEEGLANSHFPLESSCSSAITAGAATGLWGLPVAGAAIGAHRGGRTDLSEGKWFPSMVAAALAVVPGTILVVARPDESFSGGRLIGWTVLTVGVPLFTTIADRLFRDYRQSPLDAVTDMRR